MWLIIFMVLPLLGIAYRLAHLDTRAAVGSLAQPHHRRVGVIVWPAVSEHRAASLSRVVPPLLFM